MRQRLRRLMQRMWARARSALGIRGLPHVRRIVKLELVGGDKEAPPSAAEHGEWTAGRVRDTLRRTLRANQLIVVAHRAPYVHQRGHLSQVRVQRPASGVVMALEPAVRACSGTWVAHGSGTADRDVVDANDRTYVDGSAGEDSYAIRRVWLTREEEQGYYYGFSNEGLWPLCHQAYTRPIFRPSDWKHYELVNRKFAEAACAEASSKDPVVLVNDYHLALVPSFIRESLPKATIVSFWHVPWPSVDQLGIIPWKERILSGLLESDVVGFQSRSQAQLFAGGVARYLEARVDPEASEVLRDGRRCLIRHYPSSIEWPSLSAQMAPSVPECRRRVLSELGLPPDVLLGIGIDRLDYTKGIEERLLAIERMLERFPSFRGRFVFAHLAVPTRTLIEKYQELDASVEELASRVNARFGQGSYRPVIIKRAHHSPLTVCRYLRAANVCYVGSLHEGMGLLAKEFVAARNDLAGVLVLSQFAGAAGELEEAVLLNPYDTEDASEALATALTMPRDEQRERMIALRTTIEEHNVYRWAGRMLSDAARPRAHARLKGRLSDRIRVLPRAVRDT